MVGDSQHSHSSCRCLAARLAIRSTVRLAIRGIASLIASSTASPTVTRISPGSPDQRNLLIRKIARIRRSAATGEKKSRK